MINLTPLDVRKKQGDFDRAFRGYDVDSVDDFLDQVADRFEAVVRENQKLREQAAQHNEVIATFRERERAMNEALIAAQQLREETRQQSEREAELIIREARAKAQRLLDDAHHRVARLEESFDRLRAQRHQYLRTFRGLLERFLGDVVQEENRERTPPGPDPQLSLPTVGGEEKPAWLTALDRPSTGAAH